MNIYLHCLKAQSHLDRAVGKEGHPVHKLQTGVSKQVWKLLKVLKLILILPREGHRCRQQHIGALNPKELSSEQVREDLDHSHTVSHAQRQDRERPVGQLGSDNKWTFVSPFSGSSSLV